MSRGSSRETHNHWCPAETVWPHTVASCESFLLHSLSAGTTCRNIKLQICLHDSSGTRLLKVLFIMMWNVIFRCNRFDSLTFLKAWRRLQEKKEEAWGCIYRKLWFELRNSTLFVQVHFWPWYSHRVVFPRVFSQLTTNSYIALWPLCTILRQSCTPLCTCYVNQDEMKKSPSWT